MFIFIGQTLWRKALLISASCWVISGLSWELKKRNQTHLPFVFGNLMMVSASVGNFAVFHLRLSNIFLMHIMVTEMAVFGSFWIRTSASGLRNEVTGSLHLCLSFIIDHPIFKYWDSAHAVCFPKYGVDIKCDHGQSCQRIWTLNEEKWKGISFNLLLHMLFFHVSGMLGLCVWDCWQKYHTLNSWRMILISQDRMCRRWKAMALKSWFLES